MGVDNIKEFKANEIFSMDRPKSRASLNISRQSSEELTLGTTFLTIRE